MASLASTDRVVTPEILDTLDPSDPDAIQSRRDLLRVDLFLGGTRWITRQVLKCRKAAAPGIVELGAGDGHLCNVLCKRLDGCRITGLDLAAPGSHLSPEVHWRTGDLFQTLPEVTGGIVVGSLILHHFEPEALRSLGEMLRPFRVLLFSEPHRHSLPFLLSRLFHPLVGSVTRHDMPASIQAGFLPGELAHLLGLESSVWKVSESICCRGALRFKACRE